MKLLISALLFLAPLTLIAKTITYEQISKMPRSNARNFYIWRYFKQDIPTSKAQKAFEKITFVTPKLFHAYAKKSPLKEMREASRCMKLSHTKLLKEKDIYCAATALTQYKAAKMGRKNREKLYKRIEPHFKDIASWLEPMTKKDPTAYLLNKDPKTFIKIFTNAGGKYRKEMDYDLPEEYLLKLSKEKGFNKTVSKIVTNNSLVKLQKSLLKLKDYDYSHKTTFFLAMNALKQKDEKLALKLIKKASKNAYYKMDIDKTTFWKYLITKDKKVLEKLSNSADNNVYSLYAKELTNKSLDTLLTDIKAENVKAKHSINTPFEWLTILRNIKKKSSSELKKYLNEFTTKELLPVNAFIQERIFKYQRHPYIIPYREYFKHQKLDTQALILAIGRQESRFIPPSISSAYALGVMQLMPFVANAIAKQKKESLDLDDMFKPGKNLEYAQSHLKYLLNSLDNPLFIAYAYNAGMGFFNRVKKGGAFNGSQYDPFISMELIPYAETRKYGKKVLANYIIYKKLLGEPTSVVALLDKLKHS